MSKLIILTITVIIIESVLSTDPTDLCLTTKDVECKGSHNYQCSKDLCSLNEETCMLYNRYRRSFVFRSLKRLIQFKKEIKECEMNETIIDLNNYCLNRHDCLETKKLIVNDITLRFERKQVDCKCQGDFKHQCNNDYCAKDLDSCKMIQKLDQRNKIKDCGKRKSLVLDLYIL